MVVQPGPDEKIKHGIAQEFQAFIILQGFGVLVYVRTMCQRVCQQELVFEGQSEPLRQGGTGLLHSVIRVVTHRILPELRERQPLTIPRIARLQ